MRDIIIVGAGSAAREFLQFIKDINKITPTWNVLGFIADSGVDISKLTNGEYSIIGTIKDWQPTKKEVYVCAIAEPNGKKKVIQMLSDKGAEFVPLIHPTASISDYTKIGKALVMYPYSSIGVNTEIGDYVTICGTISHDNIVGDYVTLSGDARVSGCVTIGECAFLGAGSCVVPHVKIKENAFVGAGSVVIRNVKADTKVFGNPAKKMDL